MDKAGVREAASDAANRSKSFINRQVDERTTQLGQQMRSVGSDLHNVGAHLRDNPTLGAVADLVDQGAGAVESVGRYLQDADADRLVGDLENVARRQPWALARTAVVVGFGAARFLKSSSARRYAADSERDDSYDGGGGRYAT